MRMKGGEESLGFKRGGGQSRGLVSGLKFWMSHIVLRWL